MMVLQPAAVRAGWQCPECRTCYSPDVQACHCVTVRSSLADRIQTQPPRRLGTGPLGSGLNVSPPEPFEVVC